MARALFFVAVTLVLTAACAFAQAQPLPVAGRDYRVLDPPRATAPGDAIEVIEFFYYGCPVCYEAQAHIALWLAAAGPEVTLRRVPAASFDSAESFALTFHALEATGELARLHGAVYENHHFDDARLADEAKLLDWLARNGVDTRRFAELRNSPENRDRVAQSRRTFEDYDIRAVPAFVVDGRYLTTARLANGVKEMMNVVEYLVARVRAERPKN